LLIFASYYTLMKRISASQKRTLWAYLKKVYEYRQLIVVFASRHIKSKYAQTFLGVMWSVLQPLTALLIFTLFFGKIIRLDTHGIPFPLFVFSGLISWYYFMFLVDTGSESLKTAESLIQKMYFPKLVLPLSKTLAGLIDFSISAVLLVIMMLIMGHPFNWHIVFLPGFIFLNMITGLSVGIWLSVLSIRYSDLRVFIPYIITFGIWLTPVFYPGSIIPKDYFFLMYMNPMAAVISGYRWAILGAETPSVYYALSFIPVFIVFVGGLFYFNKIENKIVDIL